MLPQAIDLHRVLPELIWSAFGVLVMLLQPFVRSRQFFSFLALFGSLAGTVAAATAFLHGGPGFHGLVQSDSFTFFFRLLVGSVSFLVVLAAGPYLDRERARPRGPPKTRRFPRATGKRDRKSTSLNY